MNQNEVKKDNEQKLSEEEKWAKFVEEHGHSGYIELSEFGPIDTRENAMKDIKGGENLSYDEYLQALFNSRNNRRVCFEECYYSNALCYFNGRIQTISKKKKKVMFKRIYVSGIFMDGSCYEGKEDHVWMDIKPFKKYKVGDCLSFEGEIYRYLRVKNNKQISFGIKNPYAIKKIEPYELPSDDDMIKQKIDHLICEVCMFNQHCNGFCIANKEWRNNMRQDLYNYWKNSQ